MKGLFTFALNARLCSEPTSSTETLRAKEVMLRTYLKVINYLFQTYPADDVIAEMDATLKHYTQPRTMSPTQYAEDLVPKLLRRGEVYDQ